MEPRVSFDGQAQAYEERAGLPEAICREVAAQILDGVPEGARILDVGAGTGTLGRALSRAPIRYLGIDLSRPMLAQFGPTPGLLLVADADGAWPLADHSIDVILFSRSAHLLKSERTLGEVLRIAAPRCRVLVGRVRRPRESAGEQLKRAMQHMLRDRDLPGKNGERAKRDFIDALVSRGAQPLPLRTSAEFSDEESLEESIDSWRGKDGLAGRVVPAALKQQLLDELQVWAERELGELTKKRQVMQHYELEGVQLAE